MSRCRTVMAVLVLGLAAVAGGATPVGAAPPGTTPAPGGPTARYIVVLRSDVANPAEVADQQARDHGAQVSHVYRAALKGYAAVIPNERVAAIRADPRVDYVEADQVVHASAQVVPYGITQVGANLSSVKAGDGAGAVANVNAYIIDTGIDTGHRTLPSSAT